MQGFDSWVLSPVPKRLWEKKLLGHWVQLSLPFWTLEISFLSSKFSCLFEKNV